MRQFRWLSLALVLGALAFASSALANPVVIDNSDFPGDTCEDGNGWSKLNGAEGEFSGAFGSIEWPGTTAAKVEYSINQGYTVEVCIKDGTGFITYEITGELAGEVESQGRDSISHVSYRVTEEPTKVFDDLTVVKTAVGEWDRTVTWDLEKEVDQDFFSGGPGDVFEPVWTVTVTKTDSGPVDYRVTGEITITNPAEVAQAFSVSDVLDDGTVAVVTCPDTLDNTGTVPAGESVRCTYVALPDDDSALLNTATVSALGNADQVATDGIDWVENLTGQDTAEFSDPYAGIDPVTLDDSDEYVIVDELECSADLGDYEDGFLTFDVLNEAFLNGTLGLEASATVTIVCELEGELTVSKTADASYTITHEWDIDKGVSTVEGFELDGTPKIWLYIDGKGDETATWTVDVTYLGAEESDFAVSGVITIENTGDLAADIATVDDLGMAITDCELDGASFAIPGRLNPDETITCAYRLDLDEKVDGDNVVVVEGEFANGDPFEYTAADGYSFDDADVTEFFATVTVKDLSDLSGEVELGTVSAPDNAQFTYSEDFAWVDYGADGCGSFTYGNIATIVETGQSANATLKVNVQCFVDETAYAKGDDAICFIPTFAQWGWTNPIEPGEYTWDLWAGAAQCDTSRGTLVGTVTVNYNGGVKVEFNLTSPNLLVESHVYAGSTEFPQQRRGRRTVDTVAPGQYYIEDGLSGEIYVIVHAVVEYPDPNFGP